MRLLEVVDFADMPGRMGELGADTPLHFRQVGKRRPLITVTSCGMPACAGSWVIV
jgi:hypothetical protein